MFKEIKEKIAKLFGIYTLSQCKKDMLLLWGYISVHPKVTSKHSAIESIVYCNARSQSTNHLAKELYRWKNMANMCPCCEYASRTYKNISRRYRKSKGYCVYCPIWGKLPYTCSDPSSEYTSWRDSLIDEDAAIAAEDIYNLALKIKIEE
jgi:hypothetical protein